MREALDNSGSGGKGGRRMPMSTAELGALIPGYDFLEYVDSGGMGDVYKAVQKSLGRTVAVKLLTHLHQEREEFVERFKREAQALALLNHPNIIAVYDSGQTADGQLYYVMEFVSGMDLHHLLRREPPEARQIMEIITQVCEALHYAHERGIVHRDIKPANILIDERGRVKVADFGLAKITGPQTVDHTATGTTLGTPDYIAPEAMETGVKIDHRVDIYSLGVMIYELFTGHLPKGQWEPPSLRTGADKRVDTLVSRAMQNDPDKRYQSISEMTQLVAKLTKSSKGWKNFRRPSRIFAASSANGGRISSSLADPDAETLAMTPLVRSPRPNKDLWVAGIGMIVALLALAMAVIPKRQAALESAGREEAVTSLHHLSAPGGSVITPEQDRLLRWVFARGAFVNVEVGDGEVKTRDKSPESNIYQFADLPAPPFVIWRVGLGDDHAKVRSEHTLQTLAVLLNELGTVTNLGLHGMDVPPHALRHLAEIRDLAYLDISDSSAASEVAIPYITACKGLRLLRIGVSGMPQPESLVEKIRAGLPGCRIMNN